VVIKIVEIILSSLKKTATMVLTMIETSKLSSSDSRGFKFSAQQSGFTLIEVLMVILLIAILAYMGITQFTNFAADARNATLKANLQILRRGISTQNAQMRLRCSYTGTAYPAATVISGNDITADTTICTTSQVPATDRAFVSGSIPPNPWGANQGTTITTSSVTGTTNKKAQNCAGGARVATTDDGWCYNVSTGEIWVNSEQQ